MEKRVTPQLLLQIEGLINELLQKGFGTVTIDVCQHRIDRLTKKETVKVKVRQ